MSDSSQLIIGILGLGQIGGSLCAALKRNHSQYTVLAFDPNAMLQAAVAEYGPEQPVQFTNTAYHLPVARAMLAPRPPAASCT